MCFWLFAGFGAAGQTTQEMLKQVRSAGVLEMIDGKEFYVHPVKKGQTLYMISKAYGVDVNDIIAENPEVKNGLKADQKLRIPIPPREEQPPRVPKPPVREPEPVLPDTLPVVADTVLLPCGSDTAALRPWYKVAIMLPLSLDELASINPEEMPPDPYSAYNPLKYIQFYEGFMMALDSLRQTGIPVRVYVYDVGKDTAKTTKLLADTSLRSMNLIVGLVFLRNFRMIADFAREHHIPLVNPLSEKSDILDGNPWVIKIQPAESSQMDQLAAYLKKEFGQGQILLIRNGQYKNRFIQNDLERACKAQQLSFVSLESQGDAIGKLSKTRENVLIAFTDNSVYALEMSRRLYELRNDYPISIVGLPAWRNLEGLEIEYMVRLKARIMMPWFIDYTDEGVKRFTVKFQEKYQTDPGILAFKGYDMAFYFLPALKRYGTSFYKCLNEVQTGLLHMKFEFVSTPGNGYENLHWEVLEYDDYRLIRAR